MVDDCRHSVSPRLVDTAVFVDGLSDHDGCVSISVAVDIPRRELARLRELERKAPSEPVVRFRALYEDWRTKAEQMRAAIQSMAEVDASTADKYQQALIAGCRRIIQALEGVTMAEGGADE